MPKKKELEQQIHELQGQVEDIKVALKLQQAKQNNELVEDRESIFKKYCNDYNIAGLDSDKKHAEVERQRYVYDKLNEKGVDNTNIERYLDVLLEDIQHQYTVKQDIENKAGLISALWGVIIAAILTSETFVTPIKIVQDTSINEIAKAFILTVWMAMIVAAIGSMFYIIKALSPKEYRKFLFDDKANHFRCLVDDKCMSLVLLLDTNTNVWKENEVQNAYKADVLKQLVHWIVYFIVTTIVCYCLPQMLV